MKTKIIVLIIIGVIISGGFAFVYAQMYDCLYPPGWIKMPKSDFKYCWGLFVNGNLPDYPTIEEYLESKATTPESEIPVKIIEQKQSNEIMISGSVGTPIDDVPVTILIKNQVDDLIQVVQVTPDESGQFSYIIKKDGPIWGKTTSYLVDVKYMNAQTIVESEWILDNSEINRKCMTLEQSRDIAPFFKVPSYLPEGYSMKCSMSGMPYESYIIYHNKDVSDGWIGKSHLLIDDGAIFIHQTDERNLVGENEFATYGSATQRIQADYDSILENNPALNPKLLTINGMPAFGTDSCPDCGIQTATFEDGTVIQKTADVTTKIKIIDEDGVKYLLKAGIPLNELIQVAESLQ